MRRSRTKGFSDGFDSLPFWRVTQKSSDASCRQTLMSKPHWRLLDIGSAIRMGFSYLSDDFSGNEYSLLSWNFERFQDIASGFLLRKSSDGCRLTEWSRDSPWPCKEVGVHWIAPQPLKKEIIYNESLEVLKVRCPHGAAVIFESLGYKSTATRYCHHASMVLPSVSEKMKDKWPIPKAINSSWTTLTRNQCASKWSPHSWVSYLKEIEKQYNCERYLYVPFHTSSQQGHHRQGSIKGAIQNKISYLNKKYDERPVLHSKPRLPIRYMKFRRTGIHLKWEHGILHMDKGSMKLCAEFGQKVPRWCSAANFLNGYEVAVSHNQS